VLGVSRMMARPALMCNVPRSAMLMFIVPALSLLLPLLLLYRVDIRPLSMRHNRMEALFKHYTRHASNFARRWEVVVLLRKLLLVRSC
jgi:hypothetical protein